MKSKVKVHGYNVEGLKSSSFDFLENERYHTVTERGHTNEIFKNDTTEPHVQDISQSAEKVQQTSKTPEDKEQQQQQAQAIALSTEHITSGVYAPKRYVTTCYFQPTQIPVWYSETMILNIGSTKKKFFESIYYENKLSPFHWSETMTTRIPDTEEPVLSSDVNIPIEKPAFHYISLEPQQIAAAVQ